MCSTHSSRFSFISQTRPQTSLRYTVFGGIDEEEEREEPFFQQQQQYQPAVNGGPGSLAGYSDISDAQAHLEMSVDAYDNQAGGSIMPGLGLSALCSDD